MKKLLLYSVVVSIGLIFLIITFFDPYKKKEENLNEKKEVRYELHYIIACESTITNQDQHLKDSCYNESGVVYLYRNRIVNNKTTYMIVKTEDKGNLIILYCEDAKAKRFLLTLRLTIGGTLSIVENSDYNPLIYNIKAYSIREIK